jgi:hypothetical protein
MIFFYFCEGYTTKSSTVRFWVQGHNFFFYFFLFFLYFQISFNVLFINCSFLLFFFVTFLSITTKKKNYGPGPKISQLNFWLYNLHKNKKKSFWPEISFGPKISWPGELLLGDIGDQMYHFIHFTLRLFSRNTTVRTWT